jgi:hypothetical protein
MATFASSTTGTVIISVRRHPGDPGRWRKATDNDRAQWGAAFERFLRLCFSKFSPQPDGSTEAEHPTDEDDTR